MLNSNSVNAASIGQVHLAVKNNKKLAVKYSIQESDSISSDLSLVKPMAIRMFNLKEKDLISILKK
jgi:predicted unusual protein kinase regulating ubiquinone biosynthesis (AarF/ABC1/UbiB family)